MTAAAARKAIKTVAEIVVSETEWSRIDAGTQARIWDGRLHVRIQRAGHCATTSASVKGRAAREAVDAWGLTHCAECRAHYGDIGVCDKGMPLASPHAAKIAAARLAGVRR